MRKLLIATATLVAAGLFAYPALSAHVQKISQQSASSMCSGHGGGTKCSYCDPNHCHDVSCGKGGCTNFVYDGPKLAGKKTGGAQGTAHPVMGHPVSVGRKH